MIKRKLNPLTESELIALEEGYRNSDKSHIRERCKCILMSNAGHDVNDLSAFFGARRHTIYAWLDRWESAGLDGFKNKSGQGRKATLDVSNAKQFNLIQNAVSLHPQNLSGVAVEVSKALGLSVTKGKLKRYLKKKDILGNE